MLGLFEHWQSSVAEVQLTVGDLLVLYTDGVTEAANGSGEEFGEARLIGLLRTNMEAPLTSLAGSIVKAAEDFREGEQADDITLVLARCHAQTEPGQ